MPPQHLNWAPEITLQTSELGQPGYAGESSGVLWRLQRSQQLWAEKLIPARNSSLPRCRQREQQQLLFAAQVFSPRSCNRAALCRDNPNHLQHSSASRCPEARSAGLSFILTSNVFPHRQGWDLFVTGKGKQIRFCFKVENIL